MERPIPSSIPTTPGVYLYKDAGGRIIYVGKACNLRKRVLSYFRPVEQLTPKTVAMLSHAAGIETLTTTTEKEALLLEASLIKKHRPRYNIILRDDKQYVLFRLSAKDDFPRLEITRKVKKRDGARYFGPFTSGLAAKETWKTIHRIFPLRRCTDRAMRNRVKPCLYHHINLCLAPCADLVSREDYAGVTRRVSMLLSGKSRELVDLLREQMERAAEALDFEQAAALRDQIRAVEKTLERQAVVLQGGGDMDVLGVVTRPDGLALGMVFVRQGAALDRATFFWPGLGLEEAGELIWSFLGQFYEPHSAIPPRIVVPWLPGENEPGACLIPAEAETGRASGGLAFVGNTGQDISDGARQDAPSAIPSVLGEDTGEGEGKNAGLSGSTVGGGKASSHANEGTAEFSPAGASAGFYQEDALGDSAENPQAALEAALSDMRGGPVHISAPRNADEHRLVDMAKSNAREAARSRADIPLADRLAVALRTERPIHRIECVDVSHTGGTATKVGAVVYEDGKPRKDDYRVWNIEGAHGDDYAALTMWAARRLEHGEPWPDLLLIDGGKGQLAAVEKVLREGARMSGEGLLLSGALPSIPVGSASLNQRERPCGPAIGSALTPSMGSKGIIPLVGESEGTTSPREGFRETLPFVLASIAKARDDQGRADRRAGNVADRIFLPGRSNPLPIREGSAELMFLQVVRDAAHDFSLGRHRQARARQAFSGELQRLPGVGPHIAKLLWEHFDSVDAMRAATPEELGALPGIGKKRAEQLWKSLQGM